MGLYDSATSKLQGLTYKPGKKLLSGDVGGSFQDTWDNSTGGQVSHGLEGTGDKVKASWDKIRGAKHDSHSAEKAAAQMQANEDTQYEQNNNYNTELGAQDDAYLGSAQANTKKYQGDLDTLKGEIEGSQKDAKNTYTNETQPRLKNLMEKAQSNSSHAMSLKDAMDPNNSIAQQTRALYAQQAQNENRASLANTGTLQALGMQNMAGQMQGAGPMTGGQLQALMGANQAQSGAAYAKSQRRVQDLQDQGLQMGYDRTDKAYNQGQEANKTYRNSVGDYEQASDRQQGRDADFRGQRGDISNKTYGLQQQMADTTRGVGAGKTMREMANYNTHMGGKQANLGADIAGINAQKAADASMVTGGLQAGGTVVGAVYGGPAGAAAGGAAGKAAGDAAAPEQTQVPRAANYRQGGMYEQTAGEGAPPDQGLALTGGNTRGGFQANPHYPPKTKNSRRSA